MNSPYERARAFQLQYVSREQFDMDLQLYRRHAFVFDTPEIFVMCRRVSRDATADQIRDPRFAFDPADLDAWFIFLLAGEMGELWKLGQEPLAWIGFERHGKNLHFLPTNRIGKFAPPT